MAPEPGVGIDPGMRHPGVVEAPTTAAHAALVGGRGRHTVAVRASSLLTVRRVGVQRFVIASVFVKWSVSLRRNHRSRREDAAVQAGSITNGTDAICRE
jgi:hypothetical protein